MKKAKLIFSRVSYSFNNEDPFGPALIEPREVDCSDEIAAYSVGGDYVTFAGAPGTGKVVYRITKIDAHGIWGVEVSNTVRLLTWAEVV